MPLRVCVKHNRYIAMSLSLICECKVALLNPRYFLAIWAVQAGQLFKKKTCLGGCWYFTIENGRKRTRSLILHVTLVGQLPTSSRLPWRYLENTKRLAKTFASWLTHYVACVSVKNYDYKWMCSFRRCRGPKCNTAVQVTTTAKRSPRLQQRSPR